MPLAPGALLGHYEIISLVGSGGMGEVYRARDMRLDRTVAIKYLTGPHSERFRREARAIASLNHPNICALYDIGPDYLVMEFVDGLPLQGPLPADKALALALEIAGALEAAHRKGIAHRDLKPANILVNFEGAKLLDFGLAKSLTPSDPGITLTAPLTEAGMILGTAPYMSPEQAEGKPVDERSDIFSFGAVLYEMLTGRRAFQRDTPVATIAAVVRDEVQPLPASVPQAFRRVLARCLEKEASRRLQSARELTAALREIDLSKPEQAVPSIAVLPFQDLSTEGDQQYFSDGLAEEILNALAQLPGLRVAARTSAFALRGKQMSASRIGEELGVATALEGSVRRAGNRMRVTVQLVSCAEGSQIWSERYDREMTDVFAIQDEIAASVVEKLQVQLGREGTRRRPTSNVEAYQYYLQGRHFLHQFSQESVPRALERFRLALEHDPEYALAYAGIADCYYVMVIILGASPLEKMPAARQAALKAVDLDPELAEGHGILSAIEAMHYNWAQAESFSTRALELDPASAMARYYRAVWLQRPFGRFEEAASELESLIEQDPLSSRLRFIHGLTLHSLGCHEAAVREMRGVIEFDASFVLAHWVQAWALLPVGGGAGGGGGDSRIEF